MTDSMGTRIARKLFPDFNPATGRSLVLKSSDEMRADAAARIDAELARERDAGWVSVKERLPEPGRDVMIWLPDYECRSIAHREAEHACWMWIEGEYHYTQKDVTFWRELPAPPTCGS